MKTMWISDAVLRWSPESQGGIVLDEKKAQRSYDHLFRAEHFLNLPQPGVGDRADCISNLRKCLNHRLRLFESVYNLRRITEVGKKRPYLTVLSDVGIVRPFLLGRLFNVRNAIEYRDSTPPSVARCREFVDVVWYLLRSTDPLLSVKRSDLALAPRNRDQESPYGVSVYLSYRRPFNPKTFGWIPFELVSKTPSDSSIQFKGSSHTRRDRWKNERHMDKRAEDIWIEGRFILSREQRLLLVTAVLNC